MVLAIFVAVSILSFAILGALLFVSAGTIYLPMFWAYLAVLAAVSVGSTLLLYVRSPGLLRERLQPGKGEQDKVTLAFGAVLFVVHFVVAGLDVGRYHWSDNVPLAAQIAGLICVVIGCLFADWAMAINAFFSSAVRLQADRGQVVITSGPYHIVRHPGYAGALLFALASGVALGSWLSILPMIGAIALLLRRTVLEDRMLWQGLAGYKDYAQNVRFKLIPGVW